MLLSIRRSELYRSPSLSPAPPLSPSTETQLRARLASLFSPLESQSDPQLPVPTEPEGSAAREGEENEVEFRLFAEAVQTVCLRDEVAVKGEGGLVRARDPRLFYVPKAEGERRAGLQMMATSGEDVLEGAGRRAWGLEVPWRVKVIRLSGKSKLDDFSETGDNVVLGTKMGDAVGRKKKPGKKRRIILRGHKKKAYEVAERKRIEMERKQETEKEKRARRNREKKLKRRAKERAKKAGGLESIGSLADDQGSESDGND